MKNIELPGLKGELKDVMTTGRNDFLWCSFVHLCNESCTECTRVLDQHVMEWVGDIVQDDT